MTRPWLLLLVWCGLAWAGSAHAQDTWPAKFSVTARAELGVPLGDVATAVNHHVGYGLGLAARYRVAPLLSVYLGADRFKFEGVRDTRNTVIDEGLRAGAQADFNASGRVRPFVFGGLTANRTSVERRGGDLPRQSDSDGSPGFELGGGTTVRVARAVWVVPEVRYRSHGTDVDSPFPGVAIDRTSYLGINLGFLLRI